MRRDNEYMLSLLREIADGRTSFNTLGKDAAIALAVEPDECLPNEEAAKLDEHLKLLEESGLIEIAFRSGAGNVVVKRITNRGHDILEAS